MKKFLYTLFLVPVCILSMLTVIYLFSKKEPLFFLQSVKINGINQLSEKEIMASISPYLAESLLKIDVVKIRDVIASHPFVREVRIKRVYPFSMVIDVDEKKPSALWADRKGDIYVLDEYGAPFRNLGKGEIGKSAYLINGGEKADAQSLFKQVLAWSEKGVLGKEKISEIAYNEGNVTVYGLSDSVEIVLGKEEQTERLKRAIAVLEDAKKRGLFIKCIDARFEQGAIIRERKG